MDTEMSQHRKRTQEKKMIPPFLPGLEPILINNKKKRKKEKRKKKKEKKKKRGIAEGN